MYIFVFLHFLFRLIFRFSFLLLLSLIWLVKQLWCIGILYWKYNRLAKSVFLLVPFIALNLFLNYAYHIDLEPYVLRINLIKRLTTFFFDRFLGVADLF